MCRLIVDTHRSTHDYEQINILNRWERLIPIEPNGPDVMTSLVSPHRDGAGAFKGYVLEITHVHSIREINPDGVSIGPSPSLSM
jgi:hypothetical protein